MIALCGYAQSGKDTVAKMMNELEGYQRVAFADPLKELALEINPQVKTTGYVPLADVVATRGWEEAKKFPQVREFLQNLGVGVRNVIGQDTWLELAMARAHAIEEQALDVVFTDARFRNELDAVYNTGGWIIEVIRPGTKPPNQHVSETEWGEWLNEIGADFTITNDGSLDDLRNSVASILRLLDG